MISVVMPVCNGEKYLKEAIESILNQTYRDFEFIIVNDGSTDKTEDIILSYHDPRIRYVKNKTNLQIVKTPNKGIKLSCGKYIARMDADDISLPNRLEKQVYFLDNHPDIGVVGTSYHIIDKNGNKLYDTIHMPQKDGLIRWRLFFSVPLVHPAVMIRRDVISKVNGYGSAIIKMREKYGAQDYDLWRKLFTKTKFYNIQKNLHLIRKHELNVSSIYSNENMENSTLIGQALISDCLHEYIPLELIRFFWGHQCANANEALDVCDLIYKLYVYYISNKALTSQEKKLIREDAAIRLLSFVQPYIRNIHAWRTLFTVFRIAPHILTKTLVKSVFKIIRTNFFQNVI